jgi:putative membrane protein
MSTIRITAPTIAALLLAASVSACKKEGAGSTDTTANAAARVDTAGTPANPSVAPATAAATTTTWASPTVLGFAWAANTGEIALGKLGEKKATSPAVKAFARQMVTDHTAMLADAKKLGTKIYTTPDTAANDAHDLMTHGTDEVKDLTDKAAGADWDKNYMDKMIDDHQKVLDKLQDAAKNTTDADVSKALVETTAKVQAHLTKAQDIKAKLP